MDKENHIPINEIPVKVPGNYQAVVAKVEHIWSYASFVVEAKNEDEAAHAAYDKASCPDIVWTPEPRMDWGNFKVLVEEKPSGPEYRSWMVDSDLSPYARDCMMQAIETVERNHRYDDRSDSPDEPVDESLPRTSVVLESEISDADIPFRG